LRADARALEHELDVDGDRDAGLESTVDDEYATMGLRDPKVCVTTSRDPSSRLKAFTKVLA
jgi:U3 small nucleolar ribonucleoprotein protein IMP4